MGSEYFKRRWEETHPDHDSWGASQWYFEVANDEILRQIEVYDAGPALRYGPDHVEDEHGQLGYGEFANGEDWSRWSVSASEFEEVWARDE